MSALLMKLKLFDDPEARAVEDDLESLIEDGAIERIAGPTRQQDGMEASIVLFALPAISAGAFDVHDSTWLTTEVMGVRWYPGPFEDLRTGALRKAWDDARE